MHYDHGLIECRLKTRIRMIKKTPVRDYSLLQSDAETKAAFDQTVRENLIRQNYNRDDPAESPTCAKRYQMLPTPRFQ